jgi:hypothetical protein
MRMTACREFCFPARRKAPPISPSPDKGRLGGVCCGSDNTNVCSNLNGCKTPLSPPLSGGKGAAFGLRSRITCSLTCRTSYYLNPRRTAPLLCL